MEESIELRVRNLKDEHIARIRVKPNYKIRDIKHTIAEVHDTLTSDRQAIKTQCKGKTLDDNTTIESLRLKNNDKIYIKDLGPQISWSTVFYMEYAGPITCYAIMSWRWKCFYGDRKDLLNPWPWVVYYAYWLWCFHYAKRLLETGFIHRFSHGTMPLKNLLKNCAYYWGFTLYISYYINHPLYTPPTDFQVRLGMALFFLCEFGNLSVHLLLRNLRPPGSKERKIPVPNGNPLTNLFNYVSCPNYTYEVGAWLAYAYMTNCLPALIFALAGFYQMAVWAKGKHRLYLKEFPDYPRERKAIIPFLL